MTTRLVDFLAALKTAIKTAEPRLKTVDDYEGQLDEGQEEILQRQMPAVFVWIDSGEYDDPGDAASDSAMEVLLIIAVRNLRSRTEAVQGGAAGEPGMYEIVEAVRAGLVGQRLPDAASPPLGVSRWQRVGITAEAAIYQMNVYGNQVAV